MSHWPVIASLVALYTISQFLRNSTGVIGPDIARDLAVGPEALGMLSSAFFLSFAAAQLPVGAVIDRYGPKQALMGSLLLAVAGAALFGAADTLAGLVLARVLMGLGCSTFYVAPLALYARSFAPAQFSRLVGLQIGIGNLGALVATAPLAYGAAALGWQANFWIAAAVALLLGAVVARVVPKQAGVGSGSPVSVKQNLAGFGEVLRTPGVWPLFAMNFSTYSVFVAIPGLWGGPLLADLHGLGVEARGRVLLLMAASYIVAALVWGSAGGRFRTRKWPVGCSAALSIVILLALAVTAGRSLPGMTILLALLGVTTAYMPLIVAHGKELFPARLTGRGISALNLANMGGVFVLQLGTGFVIGAFDRGAAELPSVDAYRAMLVSLALVLALALACYSRAPETRHAKAG